MFRHASTMMFAVSTLFCASAALTASAMAGDKDGKIAAVETFVSKPGEAVDLRKQTQEENLGWYSGITADMFS